MISRSVDPMYAAFGMFLRGVRLSKKLKQSRMARHLGVSSTSVIYYEHGQRKIPLLAFIQWCEALELDPGETLNLVTASMRRREGET